MTTKSELKSLAKAGEIDALAHLWAAGERFDLGVAFERAVTDFRTVPRKPGHLAILKFCIDHGLDLESRVDWMGQTVACSAAMYGHVALIRYLPAGGLPTNPFFRAAIGDLDFLRDLAERPEAADGSLRTLRDENGWNLLHYAAGSGLGRADVRFAENLAATTQYLIDQGVDPARCVVNEIPLSPPLLCAWFGGNPLVMQHLLDTGTIPIDNLHQALEFALEPHQRSGQPFDAVAELLLARGFPIDSLRPSQGRALLHGSAHRGAITAVRWLLTHGANPNVRDEQKRTPLHWCAMRNTHPKVAQLLQSHGADPQAVDGSGHRPIDYARQHGRESIIRVLSKPDSNTSS